ncbi:MAG: hypothetical protein WBC22_02970 [Sedimentisphaerales bacterium]
MRKCVDGRIIHAQCWILYTRYWMLDPRIRGDGRVILPRQFIVADLFSSLPAVPQSIDKRSLPDIMRRRRSVDFDLSISGVFP